MKKLYSILLAATILCGLTWGCSDDDENVAAPLLKVVSSEVTFDYTGGSGIIQFASEIPVEVSSSTDWCHVALQNKEVTVTVDMNKRTESRTARVTLKAGNEVTKVPVYQHGEKLVLEKPATTLFSAKGGEISLKCQSVHDITVTLDTDWISYTLTDGVLKLTAQPLGYTGERSATCTIEAGVHKEVIKLTQEFWEVMEGEYDCFSAGKPYGTCTIKKVEENVYLITPKGSIIDAPYLATLRGKELVINFGQVLGNINLQGNTYIVILCAFDKQGYLNPSEEVEYVATLGEKNESQKAMLTFRDTGTWQGYHVEGFFYGCYDKDFNFSGNGWQAEDIVFVKQ